MSFFTKKVLATLVSLYLPLPHTRSIRMSDIPPRRQSQFDLQLNLSPNPPTATRTFSTQTILTSLALSVLPLLHPIISIYFANFHFDTWFRFLPALAKTATLARTAVNLVQALRSVRNPSAVLLLHPHLDNRDAEPAAAALRRTLIRLSQFKICKQIMEPSSSYRFSFLERLVSLPCLVHSQSISLLFLVAHSFFAL